MKKTFIGLILGLTFVLSVCVYNTTIQTNDSEKTDFKHPVQLAENVPVTLALGSDYALYVKDFFEGGYAVDIDVIKKTDDQYFEDTGVVIQMSVAQELSEKSIINNPTYLLDKQRISILFPENVSEMTLFGNRAVKYMDDNNNTYVIGYLTGDQTDYPYSEAITLVMVKYSSYGKAVAEEGTFLDEVVGALSVVK